MSRLVAGILCLLLLGGCGDSGADWSEFAPPEEDRLVIYTSQDEAVYAPIIQEFEDRTGLWVQVETGPAAALLDRVAEEQDAPACDLVFGGGADSLQARSGLFEPYHSPLEEALDPGFLCADGAWTAFSILPVALIYNPVLVRMNPPEGWGSLLDPAWKGRIAFAGPLSSSSGYTALSALLQTAPGEPEDILRAFYENLDGRVLEDSGEAALAVAEGSCTIGVALEETALKAAESHSDVALLYPREGTACVPDGMAVVKGAPHGDRAREFIDFCLGADVQNYLVRACRRRPVRTDVECGLPGGEELGRLDYDLDRAAAEREAILNRWRELEEGAP